MNLRCVFVIVTVGVSIAGVSAGDDEPTFQGKPASYWIGRVTDPQKEERSRALAALKSFPPSTPKVIESIAVALADSDGEIRAAAAAALADDGPAARPAVSALSQALQDQRTDVRKLAATALGRIGSAANVAKRALTDALMDRNDGVRLAAARALQGVGGVSRDSIPALERLAKDTCPDLRLWATTTLGSLGQEAAGSIPVVVQAMSDEEPRIREAAVAAVRAIGTNPLALKALTKALHDDAASVRQAAAQALAASGTDGVSALVDAIGDQDPTLRKSALDLLRSLGPPPSARVAVIAALNDGDSSVRESAIQAVAAFGADAVPALVDLVQDMRNDNWQAASSALGVLGSKAKDAVPGLAAMLKDNDLAFRKRGALTLARMGEVGRAALAAAHMDKDPDVLAASVEPVAEHMPDAYAQRAKRSGASASSERAVNAGLMWLARHQAADGGWKGAGFVDQCSGESCGTPGYNDYDAGLTGLSLLAFLGAGYTPSSTEDLKDAVTGATVKPGEVVEKGLRWLVKHQDADGCIGERVPKMMYNHSICTLALIEAYGMTTAKTLKGPAQEAINFLVRAKNPNQAWRYMSQSGENDTSVTGWCVMALKSAETTDLVLPKWVLPEARTFVEGLTDRNNGKCGYQSLEDAGVKVVVPGKNEDYAPHEALAAVGMLVRMLVDHDRKDPILDMATRLLVNDLPVWDEGKKTTDYYYWYYGTMALFQYDGPGSRGAQQSWSKWNSAVLQALTRHQRAERDGCACGSWDATDRWGFEGGRPYATAINVLTLEVYYRCQNVFGTSAGPLPAGQAPPQPGAPNPGGQCPTCEGTGSHPCTSPKCVSGKLNEVCPDCHGATEPIQCSRCKGRGEVGCPSCSGTGVYCQACAGSGRVICGACHGERTTTCGRCKGSGRIERGCPTCRGKGSASCKDCGGTGKTPTQASPQEADENAATQLMSSASNFETNRLPDRAIEKYKEIVEKYPNTQAALRAAERLKALQAAGTK